MFSLYTLHTDVTIENVTTSLPPVTNITDGDCFYSCPFNDGSSSEYIRQPCIYTLEVTRVFKGNYEVCLSSSSPTHSSLHAGMPEKLRKQSFVTLSQLCNACIYVHTTNGNKMGCFSHLILQIGDYPSCKNVGGVKKCGRFTQVFTSTELFEFPYC